MKRVRLFDGKSFILCPDSVSLAVSDVLLMLKEKRIVFCCRHVKGLKRTKAHNIEPGAYAPGLAVP